MKAKQINLAQGKVLIGDSSSKGSASAYSFPTSDGSANQVLETDGSGSLSWVTPSSGGGSSAGESVYIFPETTGGNSYYTAFSGPFSWFAGYQTSGWNSLSLSGFTTIYAMVDCSGQNFGELMLPYAKDQTNAYQKAPPSNITRMILKRKNFGNTRTLRMAQGGNYQINGTTQSSFYLPYTLGVNGETIVFERNAMDITNNNWRVYQL